MPVPPNDVAPVLTPDGGFTQPWRAFFAALGGAAAASKAVEATESPFTFKAPDTGSLVIQGAVTALSLIRGRDPVALDPGIRLVPLAAGDRLEIAYTTAPGLVFLPA